MASSPLSLQNELAGSASLYLRAHKDNPVAWQEWSPKTIDLAKAHERMIFLSIGYSSCHWCHVMEKESFSSPEVAEVLNNSFIPIKVDREARPDIDEIYMNFVTATTGHGGWPLNVFLTPDLKPVFGGTYWPGPASSTTVPKGHDSEEHPLSFLDILNKMVDVWTKERQRCLQSADEVTRQLQDFASEGIHGESSVKIKGSEGDSDSTEPLELDLLDDALDHFISKYDRSNGGFSIAPKFPMPTNLRFLLRLGASTNFDGQSNTHTRFGFPSPIPGILGRKSCAKAASMALHTLIAMSRSALRDQLGHGFHRYSVTADWNLPHFEKMLYDNAELLGVYCDAWALGRNPEILGTIYDLVEYFTSNESPIVRSQGGWYSSEDADSYPTPTSTGEKKEGAYYVWTQKEFQSILGDRDATILSRHFGVKADGNVPAQFDVHDELLNQNTLFIDATPSTLAKEFVMKDEDVVKIIKAGKVKLLEHRAKQRGKPAVDTKIIVSWNALVIQSLARAAATLFPIDEARAQRCQEVAEKSFAFIQKEMFNTENNHLTRVYNPSASTNDPGRDLAFIDDYANLIKAAIGLYDLTLDVKYLEMCIQLQSTLDSSFLAKHGRGYLQAANASADSKPQTDQILKLKPGTDNTVPSPNGTVASNLLYLASYMQTAPELQSHLQGSPSSDQKFKQQARSTIDAFAVEMLQHPFLYVTLLGALVMDTVGLRSIIIPPSMPVSEIQKKGLRGFNRTVVHGAASMKADEIMICTKDGVCRPLSDRELDTVDDYEAEGSELTPQTSTEQSATTVS